MSNAHSVAAADAALLHGVEAHDEHHHDDGSKTTLGFWIYLMSDCILFAAVFAAFAVLRGQTAGGPDAKELFSLPYVAGETAFLLVSSFTYGMAMIAAEKQKQSATLRWLGVTLLLGLGFMFMELHEFAELIGEGAGPDRSAFLSSFFTLVGTHGLHVLSGMVWMVTLIAHVLRRGLTQANIVRLTCLSLFWHFLDIVWIGVFTIVYLSGVAA
ncbi:cytochrome o ubiquinol oxidase subunit III [Nitrospirillum sp. BR 11164]|uniref:cytochrome o ubiquinol oxidase subunit III n=1 Tax=Nitrospirillum sp. BR 11164 TaxID=3104324 RepID=UPI002AFF1917|nr:cytochrome o ubiquinol oxidase subunit III [Nitrospirillum sp. BR 11164]MEA1652670.1 cytochrome o ubiquinol oxidase subunit III [Nitrospirillum sp. BR 11164]